MTKLRWRVQSDDDGGFDELVVSSNKGNALVHAEMMTKTAIFVSVGTVNLWAYVNKDGKVIVTSMEGGKLEVQSA